MTEIVFYQLQSASLEAVLADLLQKTLARGWRAVVRGASAERIEALTDALWSQDRDSFIPHGSRNDGKASRQPVWLTDRAENPNGASVLFLVDGAKPEDFAGFNRLCDLFDGRDPDAVKAAAERRQTCAKLAGPRLLFWRQDESGRWRPAASEANGSA